MNSIVSHFFFSSASKSGAIKIGASTLQIRASTLYGRIIKVLPYIPASISICGTISERILFDIFRFPHSVEILIIGRSLFIFSCISNIRKLVLFVSIMQINLIVSFFRELNLSFWTLFRVLRIQLYI